MYKYIQDEIRNNSRFVFRDLTRPQQKALSEVTRGLFTAGEPILRHLAQAPRKTAKRQGDKYSYHLGNVRITDKIDDLALKKAKKMVRRNTVIAYDLTDISKESARKIEKISRVFDGSERKVTNGFLLHGVGINGILAKFQVHDNHRHTLSQIRRRIVADMARKLDYKGIWVFDRGNDDKAFFKFLRHHLKVGFIARLKTDRQVVLKKTGALMQVGNLRSGRYAVYLMNRSNNKADLSCEYTLVISNHLGDHGPIRLIHSLRHGIPKNQIVTMYLERWGVENIFKRVKDKFELEKIRVLKYEKFVNLVALIQLAVLVSTLTFLKIQQSTSALIIGALMHYKKFLELKTLSLNLDSFISFMKACLKPLILKIERPTGQLTIFSRRQLEKLVPF